EDLDVQAVGVVPPIVERRRGEHGDGAPDRHPGAERRAEAPEADGHLALRLGTGEGGLQGEPAAGDTSQHAAEIDGQVRRGPEGVAADRHVPRDVPQQADDDARRAHQHGREIPGQGRSRLHTRNGGGRSDGFHGSFPPETGLSRILRALFLVARTHIYEEYSLSDYLRTGGNDVVSVSFHLQLPLGKWSSQPTWSKTNKRRRLIYAAPRFDPRGSRDR